MTSWLPISSDSDFTLYNIPFGVYQMAGRYPRAATRLGDYVIDLYELCLAGLLTVDGLKAEVLHHKDLNTFIATGKKVTNEVRKKVQELFAEGNTAIKDHPLLMKEAVIELSRATLLMPVAIGDYTDFYSSMDHATNVGSMFRPDNPLLPNWKNLPVAYHGRSSSIVLSGTNVKRPNGQYLPVGSDKPVFGPSKLMDYELEVAYIIGKESSLGEPIDISKAEEHVFGFVLFNDWSARDIQSWEYQPLGPFLSKNFMSSISPWIVTLEALDPFRVEGPKQEVDVFPYLKSAGLKNFDLELEVYLEKEGMEPFRITHSNFKYMYWNFCQQLAHHTVNGCNVRVGDMMASGTISGPTKESRGCMLELTWRGKEPIVLPDGTERKFLADGDTVVMRGFGNKKGIRVGFGEVRGKIVS